VTELMVEIVQYLASPQGQDGGSGPISTDASAIRHVLHMFVLENLAFKLFNTVVEAVNMSSSH
jgi:hypothetical protein